MAEDQLLKNIEVKFEMLDIAKEGLPRLYERSKVKELQKTMERIEQRMEELQDLKLNVQESMLENNKSSEEVRKWGCEMETRLNEYENLKDELEAKLEKLQFAEKEHQEMEKEKRQQEQKKREQEEDRRMQEEIQQRRYEEEQARKQREFELEEERKKQQFEEECKREEIKLQMKMKYAQEKKDQVADKEPSTTRAKLPKLVITKFNGTHLDWFRFWNQYQAEIDRNQSISAVTKFSYLKELVIQSVRASIDGLPFTTEGYERAKNILQTKYGKSAEIVKAHVNQILQVHTVHGRNPVKVREFYELLVTHVQALQTLGKLQEINGMVPVILDKIPNVRAELAIQDDHWQEWDFPTFLENLRKWTERNPVIPKEEPTSTNHKAKVMLQTKQNKSDGISCVYCESSTHKSSECSKVVDIDARKNIIATKRLCFNCTGEGHHASKCRSKRTCIKCNGRHHTSICYSDKAKSSTSVQPMMSIKETEVIYPMIKVMVQGIACRALLDTGAGSSYASAELIKRLKLSPSRIEHKEIETMLHTTPTRIEVYDLEINSVKGDFTLTTEVNKINKPCLISLPNPNYKGVIKQYCHLKGVKMYDDDTKLSLPVHIILGAADYTRIKTKEPIRMGEQRGQPIAELTTFGWTIMSGGKEQRLKPMLLTRSKEKDYEELCKLDVLGLEDNGDGEEDTVYQRFKNQLGRSEEGWYETNILWKDNCEDLSSNKSGSLARLNNLLKRLRSNPTLFKQYNDIFRQQLEDGIIEKVSDKKSNGREYYIPHKPVVRSNAESTKVRIVFDASAKERESGLSLNDVIEVGPPLQNNLWNVLVRNRLCPIVLTGDMKQAFLQIRIREEDRDALRFHWLVDISSNEVQTLRFTRAIFGLGESPFLLNGTIAEHLQKSKEKYPELVKYIEEIQKTLYVDDLITGGATLQEVKAIKNTAIQVFADAKFSLHKWHSNIKELEETEGKNQSDISFAKQELGTNMSESKILGVSWNKEEDTFGVDFDKTPQDHTKRGILKFLASIYDPLGLVSPVTLIGKDVYRQACELKLDWDEALPKWLDGIWTKWLTSLPKRIEVPRALTFEGEIISMDIHAFSDASAKGVSAAIYAVVNQREKKSQGMLASKSRLSKKGLTIPRLELVAAHMAANLMENTKSALQTYPLSNFYCWSDSTVVLYWLQDKSNYKQFVTNRVQKIQSKNYIQWKHVPTDENPSDLGSRGCGGNKLTIMWKRGPKWLIDQDLWPSVVDLKPSQESDKEKKPVKEIFKASVLKKTGEMLIQLLNKFNLKKTERIISWIQRFIYNSKVKGKEKRKRGPLTTDEVRSSLQKLIKIYQLEYESNPAFKETKERLNLQKNNEEMYECQGRIIEEYPIFIPPKTLLAEKMVEKAHLQTIHGGVGLTMTKIRSRFWIPKLRQLTKSVIYRCHGCRRFRATAYVPPIPGKLPTDRTSGNHAFQTIGLDYAGPIYYKRKKKSARKAYILLFTCSLSRAIHLELVRTQTLEEFQISFKRFIARRGRPKKIYSDNAKTFTAAKDWIKLIRRSEKLQNYLADNDISWQFNLSRAPWWGGQFERMVGLTKQAIYKAIGKANLTWNELEEVLLDVENNLNNRPLSYIEEDVEHMILTPNKLTFGADIHNLQEDIGAIEDTTLKKRARYLKRCKETLWERWRGHYLKSLRERHNMKCSKENHSPLSVGDVVLIKGDERNRSLWRMGIVQELIKGKDEVVRAAKIKCEKNVLERAVQHLYPLELQCDIQQEKEENKIKQVKAQEPTRTTRNAAAIARLKINDQAEEELSPPEVE